MRCFPEWLCRLARPPHTQYNEQNLESKYSQYVTARQQTPGVTHMLERIQRTLNLESLRANTLDSTTPSAGNDQPITEAIKGTVDVGGNIVRYLDYRNNPNDPEVHIAGMGLWKLSYLKKDIQNDLNRLAQMVGSRPASQLLQILSDVEGKKSSNLYVAFKLAALAEVEEFLERPSTKRVIGRISKSK